MAGRENKTQKTKASVAGFINAVSDPQRRADAKVLLKLFKDATNEKPALWGTSIVGYGQYHYKSERSTQEGDWPLTGFSPRAKNLTLYVMPGFGAYKPLLNKLGKHKISGGSCIYIKKLEDVDLSVLRKIIAQSVKDMRKKHGV